MDGGGCGEEVKEEEKPAGILAMARATRAREEPLRGKGGGAERVV